MSRYGTGMRNCCDSPLRGNRPHIVGCENYIPQDSQTLTAEDQLLPCPFCGKTKHLRVFSAHKNQTGVPSFAVRCCFHGEGTGCGAETGYGAQSEAEAWRIWNTSAALTNEPVGVTTREEWEAAQHALASLEAAGVGNLAGWNAGELAATVRKVLNRLPAAKQHPINGEQ